MATIALYANKINQMHGLIKDVKKSVMDYKSELSALKKKTLQINRNICNLDDVVSSIQASSQTQERKIASLEALQKNSEQFIANTVQADNKVAEVVKKNENDFYGKYSYLKPECKKNGWEKFCDGCKKAVKWCKEHWKLVVTVVIAIAAVVAIVCTGGVALGPIATILIGAAKGAIIGAITGGVMGGLFSMAAGGSFLDGFEDGALTGALFGGIGGAGQIFGELFGTSCKIFKNIGRISKVSGTLSFGMTGFDLLSFGAGLLFGQDNVITKFNSKLHSNNIYNIFQFGVSAIAVFSSSAYQKMKPMKKICFVAGTMILTATGFVAIENIKAGDKVISTNSETFVVEEKTVLETYVRETTKLINLMINGEIIKTTANHLFYVKDVGFVHVKKLCIGDKLIDSNGNIIVVEDVKVEFTEKAVKVYNFQVEDFHTYHVGMQGVLVHNECDYNDGRYSGDLVKVSKPDPAADALADRIGGNSRMKFLNDPDGREFDVISDKFIGQAKPNLSQYGKSWRKQTKATFEAAKQTGKRPYFQFEGKPSDSVLQKIAEYEKRYAIKCEIDITPLGVKN